MLLQDARIGADPMLMSAEDWFLFESELSAGGIQLVSISNNLIDEIWSDKPLPEVI